MTGPSSDRFIRRMTQSASDVFLWWLWINAGVSFLVGALGLVESFS